MPDTISDRCGYIWPEDYDIGEQPDHQSCCYRPVWRDYNRCVLHAKTEQPKPVSEINSVLAGTEVRSLNHSIFIRTDGTTETPAELVDGAYVPDTKIGDKISFKYCFLREVDLTGARLVNANFKGAKLNNAVAFRVDKATERTTSARAR